MMTAATGDYCPLCGVWAEFRQSFRCMGGCGRTPICLRHRDAVTGFCPDCALVVRSARPIAAIPRQSPDIRDLTTAPPSPQWLPSAHALQFDAEKAEASFAREKGRIRTLWTVITHAVCLPCAIGFGWLLTANLGGILPGSADRTQRLVIVAIVAAFAHLAATTLIGRSMKQEW